MVVEMQRVVLYSCVHVQDVQRSRGPRWNSCLPLAPVANSPRRKKKMVPNPGRLVISVRVIVCDRLCTPFGS